MVQIYANRRFNTKKVIIIYISNERVKCSAGFYDFCFGPWTCDEQNVLIWGFYLPAGWCKALKYYRTAQNSCLLCIHWFLYTLKVIMVSSPQTVEVIFGTLRGHQLSTTHTFRFVLRGEDAAVQKSWFSWRQKQAGMKTNKMQSKHVSSYCSSRWELSSGADHFAYLPTF